MMTHTQTARATLATLVALSQGPAQSAARVAGELSAGGLARVFETFSHHMVALSLVARSDAKVVARERDVMLRHCKSRALMAVVKMTSEEEAVLGEYLRHFRPTMQQLTLTLDRLKHDTKAEIAELIAAAHAVVEADGVVRLQEVAYLASLQHDLMAL